MLIVMSFCGLTGLVAGLALYGAFLQETGWGD